MAGAPPADQLDGANSIINGPGDSVYVADNNNARYLRITGTTSKLVLGNSISGYKDGPAKKAEVSWSGQMVSDGENGFYFTDYGNHAIRHYDAETKEVTTVAGGPEAEKVCSAEALSAASQISPSAIFMAGGTLYFFNEPCGFSLHSWLYSLSEGTVEYIAETPRIKSLNVAVTEGGTVLVPAPYGVWELNLSGETIKVFAGHPEESFEFYGFSGDEGPATEAKFRSLLATTRDGSRVYISDQGNERVRAVDGEGIVNTVAGGSPGPHDPATEPFPAEKIAFYDLWVTAFDSDHNMFVGSHRLTGYANPLHEVVAAGGNVTKESDTYNLPRGQTLQGETNGGCNPAEIAHAHGCHGDPVDTATGEYWQHTTDMSIPGRGFALDLSRTYSTTAADEASSHDVLGYGWTDSYGMSLTNDSMTGDVTVHQENGSTALFVPNAAGTAYSCNTRVLATLVHNESGTWTFVRKARERFTFDAEGRLIAETDLNGEVTTLGYAEGRLSSVTDPSSRSLNFAYNGAGEIESVVGPEGEEVSYGYDEKGDLREVTDLAGETWRYTYDSDHHLLTEEDPREHVLLTNVYDEVGRVESQKDALERETTFEYGDSWTIVTSAGGNKTKDVYAGGLLSEKIEGYESADEAAWKYTYDPITLGKKAVTDPNGHTTEFVYSSAGNLTRIVDPLGHATEYEYDALNDRTKAIDAEGVATTLTYDEDGNQTKVSTPIGAEHQVWEYSHEDEAHPGDLTKVTDPRSHSSLITYTNHGDVEVIVDAEGDESIFGYNARGQRTSVISPRGNEPEAEAAEFTTSFEYTPFGSLRKVVNPLNGTEEREYDADRNLKVATDPDGNTTGYVYDAANQLEEVERADNSTLVSEYDPDGNLEAQVDGAGEATTYAYDHLDRPSSVTDPLNRSWAYVYDGVGNLVETIDPESRPTVYEYDNANRLEAIDYSDPETSDATFGYDKVNSLTSMTNGTGESKFKYDALLRIKEATQEGISVGFKYDLANNETGIVYPGSHEVTRSFDKANRLEAVTDWASRKTSFDYDTDSNLTSITFPAGTSNIDEFEYDNSDRLSAVAMKKGEATLASLAYSRDPMGQVETEEQTGLPGGASTAFGYTTLNQLASAGPDAYEYDSADNPKKQAGVSGYEFDEANQLKTIPEGAPSGPAILAYDALGERIKLSPSEGPVTEYAYDQAGHLTGVGVESFAYGGDGLRLSATAEEATKHFSWDRSGSVPLLLSDGSDFYIYGPGHTPIEEISSGGTPTFFHHDQLGSTRLLTNGGGEQTATFSYSAFGAPAGSTGEQTTPLGFAGEYTDPSGLQYLRARSYDPHTGQFLSRDPATALSRSPYDYSNNNPVNSTDPTGLFSVGDVVGGLGEAANALNPLKYYEEEIDALERGCSYWDSVWHGVQGALVATAETGAGFAVARLLGTAAELGAANVLELLSGLGQGNQLDVYVVPNEATLMQIWDRFAASGTLTYSGGVPVVVLDDGTQVTLYDSTSGGWAIQFNLADGSEIYKIHIAE